MIAPNNPSSAGLMPKAYETGTIKAPKTGEKTPAQRNFLGGIYSGVPGANGTGAFDSFGGWGMGTGTDISGIWAGWTTPLYGTYWTYRTMLRHPTIAYVMSQVLAPVVGSQWLIDADDDADPECIKWVKENIIAHRACLAPRALGAVPFGNAPFEVIPELVNGKFIITEFKPLLQDATQVLRDMVDGRWCGIQNGGVALRPLECLYILNSSEILGAEPGSDYGRSRLENVRDTAWLGWMDTARRLAELEDRVSGVVPVWEVPATDPDAAGFTMKMYADAALPDLTHPRSIGAVIENPALSEIDADSSPEKYNQLKSTIKTLDMGDRAESQNAMQEKLRYWDDMLARGLLRGERTVFATRGASRADSEQHTANAEPDSEAVDGMLTSQINYQVVRPYLTLNFGADKAKKIRGIKAMPLVNREQAAASELIRTMAQNTQTGPIVIQHIDFPSLAAVAGYPTANRTTEDIMANITLNQQQAAAGSNKDAPVTGGPGNKKPAPTPKPAPAPAAAPE